MRAAARSERNETYKQRLSERCGNIASYCVDRRKITTSAFRRKGDLGAVRGAEVADERPARALGPRRMLLHIWALTSGRQVSWQLKHPRIGEGRGRRKAGRRLNSKRDISGGVCGNTVRQLTGHYRWGSRTPAPRAGLKSHVRACMELSDTTSFGRIRDGASLPDETEEPAWVILRW